ncbi:MAG: alkaline phosphatase D family protein [Myxococcales bacterium]
MSLSRRQFLYYVGPLAALPVLPKECSHLSDDYKNASTPFLHGVASGDPLTNRVVLWTRVTGDAKSPARAVVTWSVAEDVGFRHIVCDGVTETDGQSDFTVKVDPDGLKPDTTYYYRFHAFGYDSPIGRTKTLPKKHSDRLRIAFVSCSNLPYGFFNAYAAIAQRPDLDAVLHLGDYLYEYGNGTFGDGTAIDRIPQPNKEILNLSDYRTRHAQYKTDVDLQSVHRQNPFICVWDDHEVSNDAWKHGAENHQPDAEGDFEARKAAAIQAYFEWMPIRAQQRDQTGLIYRTFRFGDLMDLIMLDTRLIGRDQQVADPCDTVDISDPSRQLLGETQEQWFFGELEGSAKRGTRWRVVGQQVMFAQLVNVLAPGSCIFNPDQWDGYAAARSRVLDELVNKKIGNVAILTGDIHSSWGNDIVPSPFNPAAYDPTTGKGSLAVEFVTPAVTSPGIGDPAQAALLAGALRQTHPHVKFVELSRRGYALLDITSARMQCEWYHVATIDSRSTAETLAATLQVKDGENHLRPANEASVPRSNPPAFAPDPSPGLAVVPARSAGLRAPV